MHASPVFLICLRSWDGHIFLKGNRRLYKFCFIKLLTVCHKRHSGTFKDLMRSKNISGYFSFYVDNISIKTYST